MENIFLYKIAITLIEWSRYAMSDSALSEDELESELDNSLYSLLYLFIETLTGTRDGKRPQFQQVLHGAHLNIAHRG